MATYRVSLAFAQLGDTELDDFSGTVIDGLTANSGAYPSPPVPVATLQTLTDAFEQAMAKAAQGGTAATAAKNAAREALISALRKNANYVEIQASDDLAKLLSSGYESTSTNRAQTVLPKVDILRVENGQTGELKVRIGPVPNSKGFDGRIKSGNGDYGPQQSFKNSRSIIFPGLTPGTVYTIEVRAVGGTTGVGDWSDPVSHMAM